MDRRQVAKDCQRIERAGGDVLGYLRSLGCISPWGTWFRLQKEQLGRKTLQIKNGKPTNVVIIEEEEKKVPEKKKLTHEQKMEAVRLSKTGGDPIGYIESLGFENAGKVWGGIRRFYTVAKTEEPEETGTVDDLPFDDPNEPEPEYELYNPFDEDPVEPPAPKICRPVNYDGFNVTAVEDPEFGEFHRKGDYVDWETKDGETISMAIADWRMLYEAEKRIFGILGVEL